VTNEVVLSLSLTHHDRNVWQLKKSALFANNTRSIVAKYSECFDPCLFVKNTIFHDIIYLENQVSSQTRLYLRFSSAMKSKLYETRVGQKMKLSEKVAELYKRIRL